MAATGFIFALFIILMPIVQVQIENIRYVHFQYEIERALKSAIISAYEEESMNESFDVFKSEFLLRCPESFEYTIKLQNFENYPKLVHFKIYAENELGDHYDMEASMIEEDKAS